MLPGLFLPSHRPFMTVQMLQSSLSLFGMHWPDCTHSKQMQGTCESSILLCCFRNAAPYIPSACFMTCWALCVLDMWEEPGCMLTSAAVANFAACVCRWLEFLAAGTWVNFRLACPKPGGFASAHQLASQRLRPLQCSWMVSLGCKHQPSSALN